jgi:PAS domain S-box-containing protein
MKSLALIFTLDHHTRAKLKEILESLECDFSFAKTLEELKKHIREMDFAFIFLDLRRDSQDYIKIVKEIRISKPDRLNHKIDAPKIMTPIIANPIMVLLPLEVSEHSVSELNFSSIKSKIKFFLDLHLKNQQLAIQSKLIQETEKIKRESFLENALDAVVGMNQQGNISDWTIQAEKIFGWKREEVLNHRLSEIIIPERFRAAHEKGMAHFLNTSEGPILNTRIEVTALRKDGTEIPIELTVTPIKTAEGYHFYSFLRDLTEKKNSEYERAQNEEQFRALADSIPQLAWIAHRDGYRFWFNHRWYEYTGVNLDNLQGFGWQNVHHPDWIETIKKTWHSSIESGKPFELESPMRGVDGTYKWFLVRSVPIKDYLGKIIRWFGTNTDIDVQKRKRESAIESEERLSLALSAAKMGTYDWDVETEKIVWSEQAEILHGLKSKQFRGTFEHVRELTDPQDHIRLRDLVQHSFLKGEIFESEYRVIWPKDESVHWLYVYGRCLLNGDGNPSRVIGALIDITERKNAENERLRFVKLLEESKAETEDERERLKTIFTQAPVGICVFSGADHRYVLANEIYYSLKAVNSEIIGKTVRESFLEREDQSFFDELDQVFKTGEPYVGRAVAAKRFKDKKIFENIYVDFIYQATRTHEGKISGIVAIISDVTEQVAARQMIEETESRLKLALSSADMGTWDLEIPSNQIKIDETGLRIFGLVPEEFNGTLESLHLRIHPDDRIFADQDLSDGNKSREYVNRSYRVIWPNGSIHWLQSQGRIFKDRQNNVHRIIGTVSDITDKKVSDERLKFLSDAGALLSSSLDYTLTLKHLAELTVQTLADWCAIDMIEPSSLLPRSLAVAHLDPIKLKWAQEFSRKYPPNWDAQNGAPNVLRTGKSELYPDIPDAMLKLSAVDEDHYKLIMALGIKSAIIVPLKARGKILGVITLIGAESGRRYTQADLKFAEELADRAAIAIDNSRLYLESLQAVKVREDFLSIASHELRTPLTGLSLQLQMLQRMLVKNKKNQNFDPNLAVQKTEVSVKQAKQLGALIDNLLDVTRISSGKVELEKENLDLGELVKESYTRLLEVARAAKSEISLNVHEKIDMYADKLKIHQAITNLISNAIKYGASNPIFIDVKKNKNMAQVIVRDQGIGIAEKDRRRIFDRFERATAHQNISGLGLGLYITEQIAEAHGGTINLKSEFGAGSEFIFELPMNPDAKDEIKK